MATHYSFTDYVELKSSRTCSLLQGVKNVMSIRTSLHGLSFVLFVSMLNAMCVCATQSPNFY